MNVCFVLIAFIHVVSSMQLFQSITPSSGIAAPYRTSSTHNNSRGFRFVKFPGNVSSLAENELTLTCETSTTLQKNIKIVWHKFDPRSLHKPIQIRKSYLYNIEREGKYRERVRLKFTKLFVSDSGYYQCIAEKGKRQEIRTDYFYLTVEAEVAITQRPANRTVPKGSNITATCVAISVPPPVITWYQDGELIKNTSTYEDSSRILSSDVLVRPLLSNLSITVFRNTIIQCKAYNVHTHGNSTKTANAIIKVIDPVVDKGYCMPYNGSACKRYLGSSEVFYSDHVGNETRPNEEIVQGLMAELLSTIDPFCKEAAHQLICRYAFPACDHQQRPLQLCREDCLAVKDMFCYREWQTILHNKLLHNTVKNRGHFRLPNCTSLPVKLSNQCSAIDLFFVEKAKITTSCYYGDGRYYNGTVNVTSTGLPCQYWSTSIPHQHKRFHDVYPLLRYAKNSCRNPGGEEVAPWCYTMDNNTRWQLCKIEECTGFNGSVNRLNDIFPIQTYVIFIIVCVIFMLVVAVATVFVIRVMRQNMKNHKYITTEIEDDLNLDNIPNNQYYKGEIDDEKTLKTNLQALQYNRNDIIYIKDIGKGAFGRVFLAKAPNIMKDKEGDDNDSDIYVAVKVLQIDVDEALRDDFEREAELICGLKHDNIVRLLGICLNELPLCLLFEYMVKGDLNEYLRHCSTQHFINRKRSNESLQDRPKLNTNQQIYISLQIASAMLYLSDNNYVHRDLATRNCLVGENLQVKLSDFGLTRELKSNYYKGSSNDVIPYRWMPLESIYYNIFSVKSDVWSFGVVLWEVFSFAFQPYYGKTHKEVIEYLNNKQVLQQPDNTPNYIYDLMLRCWNDLPDNRPSFKDIHQNLKDSLKNT